MDISKKRVSINFVSTFVAYCLNVFIAFLLTPFLVKNLGVEEFSFYPLANNFIILFSLITLALNSMGARFITHELIKGNFEESRQYFSTLFISNIILAVIISIPMIIITIFAEYFLDIPLEIQRNIKILFTFLFSSMLINTIFSVYSSTFFSYNRLEVKAYIEMIVNLSKFILLIILFSYFEPKIYIFGLVIFLSSVISTTLTIYFSKKISKNSKVVYSNFKYTLLRKLLSSGVWNSLSQAGSVLLYSSDILMANLLFTSVAAGQLAVVHTIPNFINGIISMISAISLPIFTKYFAEKNFDSLLRSVHKTQLLISSIVLVPLAIFIALGKSFFSLWLPTMDADLLQKMSVLSCLHLALVTLVWPISNLNITMNKVKTPSIVFIGFGIINILIIIVGVLIGKQDVTFLPFTTMILSIVWFGLIIPVYTSKLLSLSPLVFYKYIGKGITVFIILLLLFLTTSKYIVIDNWFSLALTGGLLGISGYLFIVLFYYNPFKKT